MSGRWHVDGQPDDEVFASEGEAVARAWELTPAGGTRPAVWQVSGVLGIDRIFDVPEKFTKDSPTYGMGGRTGEAPHYTHMTSPKDRVKMVLADVELLLGREAGETIEAKGVASMSEVIDAFGAGSSSAGEIILWARKTIRELVEDRIAGPVEIVKADLRVEEDPPSRLIVEAEMRRVGLPPF